MATTQQENNTGAQPSTSREEDQKPEKLGFDPIFPVTDMRRSIQHYESLGFEVRSYDGEYAFATLPGHGTVHLSLQSEATYDPKVSAAAAYLYVEDAGRVCEKWRGAGVGETREPADTEYGLREGAHLDLDNNLIRFGSRMAG